MAILQLRLGLFTDMANASIEDRQNWNSAHYVLSLLRMLNEEHAHIRPVVHLGGHGHTAYIVDALLYYLRYIMKRN